MQRYTPRFQLPEGIDRIICGAKRGIPYAYWLLGNRYLEGRGLELNIHSAAECYLTAARAGCPLGQRAYADMIERHLTTTETPHAVLYWRLQAAHNASASAQLSISEMFLTGKGAPRDLRLAKRFLSFAKQNGKLEASRILAYLDATGSILPASPGAAAQTLEQASRHGDAKAAYALSLIYGEGYGSQTPNYKAQEYYLELSASLGHVPALRDLGIKLLSSIQDGMIPAKSLKMLHCAAESGDGIAMAALGNFYGSPNYGDLDLAQFWFKRATQTSYIGAHWQWADCLLSMQSDAIDIRQAERLMRESLRRGFAAARGSLARLFWVYSEKFGFSAKAQSYLAGGIYDNVSDPVVELGQKLIALSAKATNYQKDIYDIGLFWLQAAVEDLNPIAMVALAQEMLREKSPAYDPASGIALLDSAAASGEAGAATSLAYQFNFHRGVIRNMRHAFEINRYAAAHGDVTGMSNLAAHYNNGEGVARDQDQFRFWMMKKIEANQNGDSSEQSNVPESHLKKSAKILTLKQRI